MAIILIEEVLMGLDEVKVSLEQALTTLDVLVEDLSPTLGEALRTELEHTLRQPLQGALRRWRNSSRGGCDGRVKKSLARHARAGVPGAAMTEAGIPERPWHCCLIVRLFRPHKAYQQAGVGSEALTSLNSTTRIPSSQR